MDNCNEHENKIKEALLKRALGYEYEEKTVEAGPNGKPKSVKVTKKHVPPDAQLAADILLLMRCGRW